MIAERVLIQGGGIGGLIAATALAQRGVEVDVVEHRPAGSVLGVGLIQPANALRVMAEIGVLDDCLTAGYQGDGLQVVGPDGSVIAHAPTPVPDDLPAAATVSSAGSCAGSCSTRRLRRAPGCSTAPPSPPLPTATMA